jgi:hypothetical protein
MKRINTTELPHFAYSLTHLLLVFLQVTDWWNNLVYLKSRGPLMINSNFYGVVSLHSVLWELMMVIIMVTIVVINGSSGYDGCDDDGNIIVW